MYRETLKNDENNIKTWIKIKQDIKSDNKSWFGKKLKFKLIKFTNKNT